MSKFRQAIEQIGLANAARRLEITPQRLSNWVERGVPVEKCYAVERALEGKVTRKDLREDWREIWPELAANDPEMPFTGLPQGVQRRAILGET